MGVNIQSRPNWTRSECLKGLTSVFTTILKVYNGYFILQHDSNNINTINLLCWSSLRICLDTLHTSQLLKHIKSTYLTQMLLLLLDY